MKHNRKLFFASWMIILALLACSLPGGQAVAPPEGSGSAATITSLAATIQAQGAPPASNQQPVNPPPPEDTAQPSETPTITLSPTPSVPMVSVSQNTNCRTGPSTQYDLIGALLIGQTAEVTGKYTPANWWIIKNPNGSGTCWLWGQYATVTGTTAGLPEMIPPPTPTPSLPAKPKHFDVGINCVPTGLFLPLNVHISLSWEDAATNEDGYYIYRNDTLIATLGPNETSYSDDTTLPSIWPSGHPKPSVTYAVQAFNSAGESGKVEKSVSCP
jgi:hypothetical protein